MNLSDLSALSGATLLAPSVNTATVTGPVIDLQQYIGVLRVSQHVGAAVGTLDGKIQTSADGQNFVDANLAFVEVAAANNDQAIQLDTRAVSRYVRYVGTIAGANASFTCNVAAVGQKKVM